MQGFNLTLIASMLLVYIWLKNDLWCTWFWSEIECDGFVWWWEGPKPYYMTLSVILDGKLCEKKGESLNSEGWKILENRASFVIKLVIISPLKNYDFWWIDSSVCWLSGAFWIALIWGLKVMAILPELRRLDQNWHTCVLVPFWESYGGNHVSYSNESFLGFLSFQY